MAEEHRDDEQRAGEIVGALRAALPTSRHAEMALNSVLSLLGDGVVVETAEDGRRVRVFRGDAAFAEWIVPWPMIQFSRGRRLDYIMGADGPPSNEAPPGRGDSPLRLSGLTAGEFEVADGAFHVSVTFGQDGRVAETSRGGALAGFVPVARAIRRGGRNAVEILADHVASLDPGRAGPGRILRPSPCSASIEGIWITALHGVRDAILDGRVAGEAGWVAADGYAGTVVCAGATREAALDACRRQILRTNPRPPEPRPLPTLSPETIERFGLQGGPFVIQAPGIDGPPIDPAPANTPIAIIPLAPAPAGPPPFGEWLRLLDDRGGCCHAVLRRDHDRGLTVVSAEALLRVDPADMDRLLDDADQAAAERGFRYLANDWPAELPRLDSVSVSYSIEERVPGVVTIEARGASNTHGFRGGAIRPEGVGHGIFRQRWIR